METNGSISIWLPVSIHTLLDNVIKLLIKPTNSAGHFRNCFANEAAKHGWALSNSLLDCNLIKSIHRHFIRDASCNTLNGNVQLFLNLILFKMIPDLHSLFPSGTSSSSFLFKQRPMLFSVHLRYLSLGLLTLGERKSRTNPFSAFREDDRFGLWEHAIWNLLL